MGVPNQQAVCHARPGDFFTQVTTWWGFIGNRRNLLSARLRDLCIGAHRNILPALVHEGGMEIQASANGNEAGRKDFGENGIRSIVAAQHDLTLSIIETLQVAPNPAERGVTDLP
jgi:hypothetical protein